MISDGTFEELECSLSTDRHFLNEPILLSSCGHCVCKMCLENLSDVSLKCRICGEITDRKAVSDKECIPIKKALKRNLDSLIEIIDAKMKQAYSQLLASFENDKETFDLKIEFIKDEIEIRIESLKIELDIIHEKFKKEVESYRESMLNQSNANINTEKKKHFENELVELITELNVKKNRSEEMLYKSQNYLQELNTFFKTHQEKNCLIRFQVSKDLISNKLIGNLFLQNQFSSDELRDILNNHQTIEKIELKVNPNDVCLLPTGYILLSNTDQKNLTVYDKDFNLITTVCLIEGRAIRPSRVTCNDKDRIFLTDLSENQVIMLDLELKHIKSVGSKGNRADQFDLANGIYYFIDQIYVCDSENKRLQVLSDNLDFKKSIPLDYKPWLIRISKENVACVSRYDKSGVYFYDLETFSLKSVHNTHGYGRISEINSYFYESCYSGPKIYCYDKEGNLLEEIDAIKLKGLIDTSADGALVVLENNLMIVSNSQKKFLKLVKDV